MIKAENLLKKFGNTVAVDIPELSIREGEIWGLVGNNGAGKTTFLRLMVDLLKPDTGRILSKSIPVYQSEHWKSYTGSFIDNNFLIEFLTPLEYFKFISRIYEMERNDLYEKLESYDHFLNIKTPESSKYIRQLSSGEKHKVGVIGALLSDPEVLILDEPFNFLDPSSQIILKKILGSGSRNKTRTLILSSHNLNHISDICTRVALMEKGKIIKDLQNNRESMSEIEDYFRYQTDNKS
jgi:ABC-2 type transport system ATP-binding protein